VTHILLRPPILVRQRHVGFLLCLALGMSISVALHSGLTGQPRQEPKAPGRVAVRMAPAAPKAVAPAVAPQVLPLRNETLAAPKAPSVKAAVPQVKPMPVKAAPVPLFEEPSADTPAVASFSPPALDLPKAPSQPVDLPVLGGLGLPPLPGEPPARPTSLASTIKPYGDELVLGVLVDDVGRPERVEIFVPSRNTLFDSYVQTGAYGQVWTQMEPPLQPGEKRWLELLIRLNNNDIALP
jgi:hypothetical protein